MAAAAATFILGDGGNDTIDGGTGRDVLWGGRGDDDLNGGSGQDFLSGDFGADFMAGGSGGDIYFFHARTAGFDEFGNLASDTIQGFNVIGRDSQIDSLLFGGYGEDALLSYVQNGSNVEVYVDVDGNGIAEYLAVTVLDSSIIDVSSNSSFGDPAFA